MNPVRTVYNKAWIPYESKVEYFICNSKTAFEEPVTTVHGFFFNEKNQILLVEHTKRGWEVPGGHIEAGESHEEAMRRELWEESQMRAGELWQLGYLKKTALEEKPENCQYPYPVSYCIFYGGRIQEIDKFQGDNTIISADFFELSDAEQTPWIIAYKEYFDQSVRSLL